jgi:cation diffusion facilitator family transporter
MSQLTAAAKRATSEALEAARRNPETSLRTGTGAALGALSLNALLGGLKLAAGLLGHSYALVADAAESFTDVFSSAISFVGLRVAARPADPTHPSGHGRAETLASMGVAIGLMAVGGLICWHATLSLAIPRRAPDPRTLLVLVPVIAVKEWMFHRLRARALAIGSVAIVTEAWHQRADVVTSVAALGGILIAWIGGPAWSHADSWAAIAASVWLVGVGLWLLNPPLHELMEGSVDPALMEFVRETGEACQGIRGIDKIWVRKLGMRLMIDLHVEVDPRISVQEGHRLAHMVKARIKTELPQVLDVMVHVEPYDPMRLATADQPPSP